jgi:hypothetical protein
MWYAIVLIMNNAQGILSHITPDSLSLGSISALVMDSFYKSPLLEISRWAAGTNFYVPLQTSRDNYQSYLVF